MRIKAHKATALPLHRIPPASNGDSTQHRVIHHADFTHHLIHCGHRITRSPHRRRFVEAGVVRRTDVAVRSRRRNPDSGHTGTDHPTDFRGDACWSDAAVASGGFRRRRLPGSWCSRSPGVRGRRFHHALVGPSAGFLFGFLPGVIVIALLRGKANTSSRFRRRSHRRPLPADRSGWRRRGGVRPWLRHSVRADRRTDRRRGLGFHGLRRRRRHQGSRRLLGRSRSVQARSLTYSTPTSAVRTVWSVPSSVLKINEASSLSPIASPISVVPSVKCAST